jgi:hypothetical protein
LVLHRQLDRLRRKLERKSKLTVLIPASHPTLAEHGNPPIEVDSPGPATLMSRLMRQELEQQKRGNLLSRWLNRPWVLFPLFVLCLAIIVWRLFWPESNPPAEVLFQRGVELMESPDPADWDKAWSEYLEPLNRAYPDHKYESEVKAYAQKIKDQAALRRALAGVRESSAGSDAQGFYEQGLHLCRQGDADAARRVWQNVVRAFHEVASEDRWVRLSEQGLRALSEAKPVRKHGIGATQEALRQARRWRDQGQRNKAEEIWKGLEALYGDDLSAQGVLREVERDRKQ